MKNIRLAAIALAVVASVSSCDKDDNAKPSTLSKIQAKWGIQNILLDFDGTVDDSTYTGVSADYIDFRTDSKVYSQVNNEKDTSAYKLVNDSTLVIDTDTARIQQLSGSQFVITETNTELGEDAKITYNLKK